MTVAEKLTAIGENMPKVYDGGKAWVFAYMVHPDGLFYKTAFPEGTELKMDMPVCDGTLTEMFRLVTGLDVLELNLPDVLCKANYSLYGSSVRVLRLPNGLRASDFTYFANRCSLLEEVWGRIDLTESSSNENCFNNCKQLREVRFAPGSIRKSLSFYQSDKLSAESVASILAGLATVQETQTLSLHATVKASLTAAQLSALTAQNWQLA